MRGRGENLLPPRTCGTNSGENDERYAGIDCDRSDGPVCLTVVYTMIVYNLHDHPDRPA